LIVEYSSYHLLVLATRERDRRGEKRRERRYRQTEKEDWS